MTENCERVVIMQRMKSKQLLMKKLKVLQNLRKTSLDVANHNSIGATDDNCKTLNLKTFPS